MKKTPFKTAMWAIMKDGETYMILPDIDTAETHLGLWSKNGFSRHKWELRKVEVRFPHETPAERRARHRRHIQQVIDLNYAIANPGSEQSPAPVK